MRSLALAALVLMIAPALTAQAKAEPAASTANPITATIRQMEEHYATNLTAAAEEMPAEKYNYRPTAEQMTFGHLVMHVVQSNNSLCAAAAGEQPRATKLSENDSKDMLVRVLKDSFAYCQQVLAKADDSALSQPVTVFGHSSTRGAALLHMASGWGDHYSAAAMYLRLNNLLPPTAKKAD